MADFARGERLRHLREDRHLSQEDAAHEIGVSTKTVRAWEHGGKIKWENAKRAAMFYRVEAETLVARDETTPDVLGSLNGESQLDRIEQKLDLLLSGLLPDGEPEEVARAFEQASEQAHPAPARTPSSKSKTPAARRRSG